MKKSFPIVIILAAGLAALLMSASPLAAPALPPVEADAAKRLLDSPRHGEWVSIPAAKGGAFEAWVVYPERSGPAPVVIVIHEIFGLTEWARAVADQYAAEGFIAIAPDFLSGKAPDGKGGSAALGADASRGAIAKLDPAEILARLDGAAAWGTGLPAATKKYGVVGFCWGGGISYGWATAQPGLGAAVGYYGTAPGAETIKNIKAPVLALYGGSDARVTATLPAFKDEMSKLGKRFESEVYDGAGHAFLRQQSGQNGANLSASQKAWPRTVAFLRETLEGVKTGAALPSLGKLVVSAEDECAEFCELPVDLAAVEPVGHRH